MQFTSHQNPVIQESIKAYKLRFQTEGLMLNDVHEKDVWFPKSQVKVTKKSSQHYVVDIPNWLAEKNYLNDSWV